MSSKFKYLVTRGLFTLIDNILHAETCHIWVDISFAVSISINAEGLHISSRWRRSNVYILKVHSGARNALTAVEAYRNIGLRSPGEVWVCYIAYLHCVGLHITQWVVKQHLQRNFPSFRIGKRFNTKLAWYVHMISKK